MKHSSVLLFCCAAFASTAAAQLSNYLGPGILTNGAGDIGNRAGEQVDLRFYADVNGIYDNGLTPFSVDSKGNLVQVGGLYGIEGLVGVYGSHMWRTSLLGIDFRGDFRHYPGDTYYDGSDQYLGIGYTYQKSKRLYFDFRGTGSTYSNYIGAVPGDVTSTAGSATPNAINPASLQLFDSRTDYLQGTAGMTYLFTPRLSVTFSGEGFWVHYQASQLIGVDGYGADAKLRYRLSRTATLGGGYSRQYFEYPSYFGNANFDVYSIYFSKQLGRLWTFTAEGGAYHVNMLGLQTVALTPEVAALLGVSTSIQTYQASNWLPSVNASLARRFKTGSLTFNYASGSAPGNGVYLASRSEQGAAVYSYTGIHRVGLSVNAGYWSLSSFGQDIPPYRAFTGGAGFTYTIARALRAVARYDARQQDITIAGYRATSYRVTLGLAFSPGAIPLSLW